MPLSVSYHQIVIHSSPQLQGPSLFVRLRHSTRQKLKQLLVHLMTKVHCHSVACL